MTAIVLRADARDLPLPDACVDLIVTSPPYFGLRSYTDGGEHYAGQIGSEATPAAYVAALIDVHARVGAGAEAVRVASSSTSATSTTAARAHRRKTTTAGRASCAGT